MSEKSESDDGDNHGPVFNPSELEGISPSKRGDVSPSGESSEESGPVERPGALKKTMQFFSLSRGKAAKPSTTASTRESAHGIQLAESAAATATKQTKSSADAKKKLSKPDTVKFQEDDRKRTQNVTKRGATIERSVKEFTAMSGGKAYMKLQYISKRGKIFEWKYGENFKLKGMDATPSKLDTSTLADAVTEAVKKGLKPIVKALGKSDEEPQSSQSSSGSAFFSPARKVPKTKRSLQKQVCTLCLKEEVIFGDRAYESGWIGCNWTAENMEPCPAWAHTDCVGFPGLVDEEKIAALPDYYCRLHKQKGRAAQNVPSTYAEGEKESPEQTQQKKVKKVFHK